jgi:hypothetical protein
MWWQVGVKSACVVVKSEWDRHQSGLSLAKSGQVGSCRSWIGASRSDVGAKSGWIIAVSELGRGRVVVKESRGHFIPDLPDFGKKSSRGESGSQVGTVWLGHYQPTHNLTWIPTGTISYLCADRHKPLQSKKQQNDGVSTYWFKTGIYCNGRRRL